MKNGYGFVYFRNFISLLVNTFFHICFNVFTRYKHSKYILHLGLGFFLISSFLYAQITSPQNSNKTIEHQISIRHDNDFLTFTDRYYSSGLFLKYSRLLKQGLFSSGQEQMSLALAQEIYTPSRTNTTNIVEMDRPYAGFLGLSVGWSYTKNVIGLETNLLVGIAGKASGSGDFHRWYHNALDVPSPPTWVYEIDNSFHVNLYGHYSHEWQLATGDFSVYFAVQPKFAVGTKDIYAYPELITYFGKRNTMSSSSAYNNFSSTDSELFFALRAGYKFIVHNAMLEGHLFGDHSPFLVKAKSNVFYAGFDLQHRDGQNEYWFGYQFNSAETNETQTHNYISLSYARNF